MENCKNYPLRILSMLLVLLISIALFPSNAFALSGVYKTGDCGESNGGDATQFLGWFSVSANGKYDYNNNPPNYGDYVYTEWHPAPERWGGIWYGPYSSKEMKTVDGKNVLVKNGELCRTYGEDCWYAGTVARIGQGAISKVASGNDASITSAWNTKYLLNDEFYDLTKIVNANPNATHKMVFKKPTLINGKIGYLEDSNGDMVFRLHYDESDFVREKTYKKEKTVIIKTQQTGTDFDHSSKTSTWLWNNGRTSGTYQGITPPTGASSHNYSNTVKVTTVDIRKTISIQYTGEMPKDYDAVVKLIDNGGKNSKTEIQKSNITYTKINGSTKTMSKTITYKANMPAIQQTKYKPLNLNRNNYAQLGDGGLTNDFSDSFNKIDANVDNLQNITDGSALNALDINNDTPFKFKFNNNQFGMTKYDFLTEPSPLQNGPYEYAGDSYANGRIGDRTDISDSGTTGYYRFNLKFNASISSDSYASLLFKDQEILSKDSLIYEAKKNIENFKGGDWKARFIKAQNFQTDNSFGFSDWRNNYWGNQYTQSRFYEYGMSYNGTFNTESISNASLVTPNKNPKISSDSNSNFTSDGLTQRGLYVGQVSSQFYQPVLYANWEVKTLAGDTRN